MNPGEILVGVKKGVIGVGKAIGTNTNIWTWDSYEERFLLDGYMEIMYMPRDELVFDIFGVNQWLGHRTNRLTVGALSYVGHPVIDCVRSDLCNDGWVADSIRQVEK